jgi:hypothetical protein
MNGELKKWCSQIYRLAFFKFIWYHCGSSEVELVGTCSMSENAYKILVLTHHEKGSVE